MTYPKSIDFLIVGAGAAGLYMANELVQKGFSVMIAEQRVRPTTHSKSIGIHPPSLRLLENLGLLDQFLKSGVSVTEGLAFVRQKSLATKSGFTRPVGSMKLGSGEGSDRILVVPQYKTEAILSENLPEGVLFRGLKLIDFSDEAERGTSKAQDDSVFPVEAIFEVNPEAAMWQSIKTEKSSSLAVDMSAGEANSENKKVFESSDNSISTGNSANPDNTSSIGNSGNNQLKQKIRIPENSDDPKIESPSERKSETIRIKCRYLIGADGMHSHVRSLAKIDWNLSQYPWPFCMGDFPDNTDFGSKPAIFLTSDGLTESFPLPGNLRRWVINLSPDDPIFDDNSLGGKWHSVGKTVNNATKRRSDATISVEELCRRIKSRTDISLQPESHEMFSSFSIYRGEAATLAKGNVFLVGDSAHVISPIGGQGMNLGWMNIHDLVRLFSEPDSIRKPGVRATEIGDELHEQKLIRLREVRKKYSAEALARARKFAVRAEFNTKMGLPGRPVWLMRILVRMLLSAPLRGFVSRRFTMQ